MTTYYVTASFDCEGERHVFQVSPFNSLEDAISACDTSFNNMTADEKTNIKKLVVLDCIQTSDMITFGEEVWSQMVTQ